MILRSLLLHTLHGVCVVFINEESARTLFVVFVESASKVCVCLPDADGRRWKEKKHTTHICFNYYYWYTALDLPGGGDGGGW